MLKPSKFIVGQSIGIASASDVLAEASDGGSVVMLIIGSFLTADVPGALRVWRVNGQELALKYEKLLTLAVQKRGLPQYDFEAVAGSGGMSAKEHGEHGVMMYALWVVAGEARKM